MTRLKVCLNGARRPAEHPGVPVTPTQLAESARASVAAGADAVHAHPRSADGRESLRANDIGAAVGAIRAACPGTPVGVSTGLWITDNDPGVRRSLLAGWAELPASDRPDFASVNLSEPGAAELVAILRAAGIGAEAGVWSVADARLLSTLDGIAWVRVLVEVIDARAADAVRAADAILGALPATVDSARLLHGEGEACWPLIRHAGALDLATRIGLEDTLVAPDGTTVPDNATLVAHALTLLPRH